MGLFRWTKKMFGLGHGLTLRKNGWEWVTVCKCKLILVKMGWKWSRIDKCGLILVKNRRRWIKVGECGLVLETIRWRWVRAGQSEWMWVGAIRSVWEWYRVDGDTLMLVKNWCKGISMGESGLTLDKNLWE